MARRRGGGSSVVLVVFLIFFILLSIGLGVSTYLGFSQDDDKAGKLKKKEQEAKDWENEAEWYKFQATAYRVAMGQAPNDANEKLVNLRDRFDKKALTKKDEVDEVTNLVTKVLDPKLDWDKDQKRWKQSYESLLTAARNDTTKALEASKNFQAQQEAAKKRADDLDQQLATAKTTYEQQLKDQETKATMDLAKLLADNKQLETEKDALSKKTEELARSQQDDKRLAGDALKKKDDVILTLRKQLQVRDDSISELKRAQGRDVPANLQTDWKITRIDARGETAYINLGSADKVHPQLTFRVHGIGPDGRPEAKDKATLEVMNVLNDHLAQAKIIYIKTPRENPRHDPAHHPVVVGDVLINPVWNPNQKRHIAIAGVVDLTGSGRDETPQFVRALEKQGVIVDAYLDLRKDFTIKGPGISVQTDFMVLGEVPKDVLGLAAGPGDEVKKKITEGMNKMQAQAKENGVRIEGLRRFLEEIGYRIPGNVDNKDPVIDLRGGGEMPPAVPKEPMIKEDKPMPPADR